MELMFILVPDFLVDNFDEIAVWNQGKWQNNVRGVKCGAYDTEQIKNSSILLL